jgi:hypothetical protein
VPKKVAPLPAAVAVPTPRSVPTNVDEMKAELMHCVQVIFCRVQRMHRLCGQTPLAGIQIQRGAEVECEHSKTGTIKRHHFGVSGVARVDVLLHLALPNGARSRCLLLLLFAPA